MKNLSVVETARLLRQALKESFPGVKFGIRSSSYANGASVRVNYTDGPTTEAVKTVTDKFDGSYFDGMTDYKGSIYHTIDGEKVSLGNDFVFLNRHDSDVAVQYAIDKNYEDLKPNFLEMVTSKPTVAQYNDGFMRNVPLGHGFREDDFIRFMRKTLNENTWYFKKQRKSKTADSIVVTGDDGYAQRQAVPA